MRLAYNFLLLIDQFLNTLLLGDPSETVSMRLGRWHASGNIGPFWFRLMLLIDFGFLVFAKEKNHCSNAYLDKRLGDRDLINPRAN